VEWRSKSLGSSAGGVGYEYAREVFPEASVLKLGLVYPLPRKMIADFASQVERLVVLEELDPFIEDQVRLMGVKLYQPSEVLGYPMTKSIFSISGEFDPAGVRASARKAGLLPETAEASAAQLRRHHSTCPSARRCCARAARTAARSTCCTSWPAGQRGYWLLHSGHHPALSALHTCGCMGASIGVAHGAAIAGDKERHVAVIGDSTFSTPASRP